MNHLPSLDEILQKSQLPALDGFRMIAVISVVLFHANIGGFFFTARHGVAGFFVLSGFLITWLLLKEHRMTGHISLKDFYYRRSLRIFPAYYTFVALTISWDLFRGNSEIREFILPSIFYYVNYHNAINGHTAASVTHLWSLAIEEQFYLIWPLLLIFMLKPGKKSVINFLAGIIVLVMIWRSVAISILGLGQDWAYNSFDTRIDNLATGCLLAMLIEKRKVQEILQFISSKPWMPIVTVALLSMSRAITSFHYEYGPAFSIDAV
ncbi:MAG: acyltransferase, partial [Gammaproteobacteria bacterium]|nr:acyltransferase [Gammaproteobacteria bacterium]